MINPSLLKESDKGRWVIFYDGRRPAQRGLLKGWNLCTVFVVFHFNDDPANYQDYTGQACNPGQVTFEEEQNETV